MRERKCHIVIRADGSSSIGSGHLMRAKSMLSGLLARGCNALLLTLENSTSRHIFADSEHIKYFSEAECSDFDHWPNAELYIVDLYEYSESFYKDLKAKVCDKVMLVDDELKPIPDYVDGVINHNLYASDNNFPSKLIRLCGPQYFMLRPEVVNFKPKGATPQGQVAICMGGSDPEYQTYRLAKLVRANSNYKLAIILGEPCLQIEQACSELTNTSVYVRPANFLEILSQSMYSVTGAGTLAYELAYLGIPAILVTLADNQRRIAQSFAEKGIALSIGPHNQATDQEIVESIRRLENSPELLDELSNKGRKIIDGKGTDRLCSSLIEINP